MRRESLATAERDDIVVIEPGDTEELDQTLLSLDDAGDHGTKEQRFAAFHQGYDSSDIESCLGQR